MGEDRLPVIDARNIQQTLEMPEAPPDTETILALVHEAEEQGFEPRDFDAYVRETASNLAGDVTRDGLLAQFNFLLARGWKIDIIRKALQHLEPFSKT